MTVQRERSDQSGGHLSSPPSSRFDFELPGGVAIHVPIPELPNPAVLIPDYGAAGPLANLVNWVSGVVAGGAVSTSMSAAGRLKVGLGPGATITARTMKQGVLGVVSLSGLIATCGQALMPRGPGGCDRNGCERCCNIITSVPYMCCGCHAMRNRRTARGRTWGASLVGVGASSMIFHGSWGRFREWGRRLDFWTIAAASNLMTRALFPNVPASVTAAGMLAVPFKPFLVSTVNSIAMELKFLERAAKNPRLRGAQRLHAVCCGLGLCAFALEDWKPELPLVHSAWHCLSSVSVATINVLMADVEQQLEERQGHKAGQQQRQGLGSMGHKAGGGVVRQSLESHVTPLKV